MAIYIKISLLFFSALGLFHHKQLEDVKDIADVLGQMKISVIFLQFFEAIVK